MGAKDKNTFDAIVIGSGISGGWSAKELTEKGLKTLLLDRGRDVKHVADYPTAMHQPWDFPMGDKSLWKLKKTIKLPVKILSFLKLLLIF